MRLGDFSLTCDTGTIKLLFSSADGLSNTLDKAFTGPDFGLRV